jgi:hypothetical protein
LNKCKEGKQEKIMLDPSRRLAILLLQPLTRYKEMISELGKFILKKKANNSIDVHITLQMVNGKEGVRLKEFNSFDHLLLCLETFNELPNSTTKLNILIKEMVTIENEDFELEQEIRLGFSNLSSSSNKVYEQIFLKTQSLTINSLGLA